MSAARVEYRPLGSLAEATRNPKRHDVEGIAASIVRFGFSDVLVEDAATGRLVAGHGRLAALRLLKGRHPKLPPRQVRLAKDGEWLVPVLAGVDFASEAEAEGYLLADNRWVEIGGWDRDALASILSDLKTQGEVGAFDATGWTVPDFAKLVKESAPPAAGPDGPVEAGEPKPADTLDATGDIRAMIFPFTAEAMATVLPRLQAAMANLGVSNHTEVILKLLEAYESSRSQA